MKVAALIVAAGRGVRASGTHPLPKQYQALGEEPMLTMTLRAFVQHPRVADVLVVIHPDDMLLYEAAAQPFAGRLLEPAEGGPRRQESVYFGLQALKDREIEAVLIHDAARPFVDAALIDRVLDALDEHDGALPALAVSDTLKRSTEGKLDTVERAGLWRAQTPQGFRFPAILEAHEAAAKDAAREFTDDAAIAEWAGLDVVLVEGAEKNRKITTAEDLVVAEERLTASAPRPMRGMRIGSGYDVHAFGPGEAVTLCGVRIPHAKALVGHSDADVALHALTDALLGAIAAGDIGSHFPPSDERWRGAASEVFVRHAAELVAAKGGEIMNVDITLLCEAPRIGPHRDAMRASIAEMLGISPEQVGVKATTNEGLGFIGREEGIAALASAMLQLS